MDNYKNAPQSLYGLSPSQMDMFMTEDNPVRRQSEKVTEVHLLIILWFFPSSMVMIQYLKPLHFPKRFSCLF